MISSLAHIDPKAQLGKGVTVEPFATIYGDVVIGDGTWIGSGAVIYDGARIGSNCRIFNGASISAIPQDLKFSGEETTLEIGDNTTVREFATLNRGTRARGRTIIGKNCLLMAYVHVAHDCSLGDNVIMVASSGIAGEVELGNWVTLGGGTIVHQFVRIGNHAFLGGGSKVRMDVPPFIKADREPLAYMGINSVGLERRGFTKEKMHELHEIYRAYFNMGMNGTKALEYIGANFPSTPERDYILDFISKSARGVIRGR
ncbi:MAG: acyl-ACP--UDP-N-acetylglucosamine O-acyltransferase [Bacteroidales bacterium]|jgi:UDP-N-acetylglucosamine acyltransferase|nr:acyl-ACP--UDP-N-acetylglucosamine O-acyltransferase [Bacteroidales bacterium]MDX9927370.1 acyl-ACP--UDP-N-acetylglucosamine O-acyltransferase [Bacteroidales bacterium]HNX83431.1 acyl-ACP--UDP-N-acetylglucosamine O-acyltransferase [Bacteroidales bacterium]HOC47875.1 acyl-ACP--UDP-N-acetylglucosamine O-acyltransferase [Bacteroidales bacterium]HPS97651.1 acyl-ACP--UDP-N-acetylglucosamine O-acyltransferase [Bacteroidales bacterium]